MCMTLYLNLRIILRIKFFVSGCRNKNIIRQTYHRKCVTDENLSLAHLNDLQDLILEGMWQIGSEECTIAIIECVWL